jgi:hypothetical protein
LANSQAIDVAEKALLEALEKNGAAFSGSM